jgi:precorrin-2 dehydrogenase/sirohydrochlorin ferrochelatase
MSAGPAAALPIVLTGLANATCTVVGGGEVAQRKVAALLEGGADRVRLVAPELTGRLSRLAAELRIEHLARRYRPGDLIGSVLAIAASDDPFVNEKVAAEAAGLGILINVADAPELGNFTTPAVVRRGPLLLTVSTGGASPTLAATIRRDLARRYGAEHGHLLELLSRLRPEAARRLPAQQRRAFWRSLTSRQVLAEVRRGHMERVEAFAEKLLAQLSAPATGKAGGRHVRTATAMGRVEGRLAHTAADTRA